MAGSDEKNNAPDADEPRYPRYLILRSELVRITDLFRFLLCSNPAISPEFIRASGNGEGPIPDDHRWVIAVSIIAQRIISFIGKPMQWTGLALEFVLNLLSENEGMSGLLINLLREYQKERSTQVYILCDKPQDANIILISFRGTEPFDADDWLTDFDYSWYQIPQLGRVHLGFLEALGLGNRKQISTFERHLLLENSMWENITETDEDSAYYAVKGRLKSLLDEHQNAKFVITGHSLGGALAILFLALLLLHKEDMMRRLLGVYTFGQPRVGDFQLGRFMESHIEKPFAKYFRVVYCNDVVPRLPYDDKEFLYKHFGTCLYYNNVYIEQQVEEEPNKNYFAWDHLIPLYSNAFWELLRGLIMGYIYGPEYKESWLAIMLRFFGLSFPGISAHSTPNYVNSIRLGR